MKRKSSQTNSSAELAPTLPGIHRDTEKHIQNERLPVISPIKRLLDKELIECARQLDLHQEELSAWLNLQAGAPDKTLLCLLRSAKDHSLDPLKNEILITQYDQLHQVSISVDGWIKLIHRHPNFAGLTFAESSEKVEGLPIWMECTIYRNNLTIPTTIREYYAEVKAETSIWQKMPRRMLRHRTLAQCARVALGITPLGEQKEEETNPASPTTHKSSSSSETSTPSHQENLRGVTGLKIRLME